MNHVLTIGKTKIPYRVRYSDRARRKRIVVTPDRVEVVVPAGTPMEGPSGIEAFVHTKRRWMFDATREVAAKQGKLLTQHYASGAKLQYRGRWLMLDVESSAVDEVEVTCRSKFHVVVPNRLKGTAKHRAVQTAFHEWLKDRADRDLQCFTRQHASQLNAHPKGARLSDAKHAWGTCGKDGIIRVHWRLIQAPRAAMEYVTAHELAHLEHRNHSPAFWRKLAETMANWAEAKGMLERWEGEHRAV
jgi:predicted metal-dependent hydrolase